MNKGKTIRRRVCIDCGRGFQGPPNAKRCPACRAQHECGRRHGRGPREAADDLTRDAREADRLDDSYGLWRMRETLRWPHKKKPCPKEKVKWEVHKKADG